MSIDVKELSEAILNNLIRSDAIKRAHCVVEYDDDGEEVSAAFHFTSEAVHEDLLEDILAPLLRALISDI
jgi:hypothetical protein